MRKMGDGITSGMSQSMKFEVPETSNLKPSSAPFPQVFYVSREKPGTLRGRKTLCYIF
jgi:hypothetical protein